jgi:PAS domain S-box-containing protein
MDIPVFGLSLICLLSSFITFGLGIAAWIKDPRSSINRIFFIAMLFTSWWAFGEFMIWQMNTADGVLFWLKASSIWPFVIATTFHFILAFTNPPLYARNPVLLPALVYIPAAIIAGILLFTDWIFVISAHPGGGFAYYTVQESLAYQFEAAFNLLIMLGAAVAGFSFYRNATTPQVKMQALLIGTGITAVIVFGFLSGILLPALGIVTTNLVFIGIVIFSIIISFGIRKHDLFVLSPRAVVPDILDTMPDAMILADRNGTIISTNRAAGRVFGRNSNDLPGRPLSSCIPPLSVDLLRNALGDKDSIADFEVMTGPSEERTVSITGSVVQDPAGNRAGFVLIARDITDRKAAEQALMIAGKKISLLTQVTRHDINNLISALSGYLLLLKEDPDDPARHSYITACMEITSRIQSHLVFTREYQDLGSKKPVWLDLAAVLSESLANLPTLKVTTRLDIAPVEVFADPMFVKVLYNLLENAVRHGSTISRIHISAIPKDDHNLLITVEDDGAGIPAEDKENIFRYGFGKNTGLGLAVSRDILSLTGITIAENGTWGSGARFEMIVPSPAWRPLLL